MKAEHWIAIAGIAVQTIIAAIGFVIMWKIASRPTQVILATTKPNEKVAKDPIQKKLRLVVALGAIVAVLSTVWLVMAMLSTPPFNKLHLITTAMDAFSLASGLFLFLFASKDLKEYNEYQAQKSRE